MDTRLTCRYGRSYEIDEIHGLPGGNVGVVSDIPRFYGSESISGYRGPRRLDCIHSCTHTRTTLAPAHAKFTLTSSYWPGSYYKGSIFSCPNNMVVSGLTFDREALSAAMQDLAGEIPTEMLLPNFIMELPEALTMHKQIHEAVFQHGPKSWFEAGHLYARRLGKDASNVDLLYNFGIKPLASDLVSLATLSSKVSKRVHSLANMSTDRFTRWRRSVRTNPASVSVSYGDCWNMTAVDESHEVTATGMMFAQVKPGRTVNPETELLAANIDAYGFSQLGSVIWEAIPFSFVADWFTNAGSCLDGLNMQAFQGVLVHKQLGWLSKVMALVKFTGIPNLAFRFTTSPLHFANGTAVVFNRGTGLPPTFTEARFGLRQSLLSGALALQRA